MYFNSLNNPSTTNSAPEIPHRARAHSLKPTPPPRTVAPPSLPPRTRTLPNPSTQQEQQQQQRPPQEQVQEDSRNSVGSSLYDRINDQQIEPEPNQGHSYEPSQIHPKTIQPACSTLPSKPTKTAKNKSASRRKIKSTHAEEENSSRNCRLKIYAKLWLIVQTFLMLGFGLACLVVWTSRRDRVAAARLWQDRAWMRLVFHVEIMNYCTRPLDDGCQDGKSFVTTGASFGPLKDDSVKPAASEIESSEKSLATFAQLEHEGQRAALVVKRSAVYRIFGQVTFSDKIDDMPAETSVMVNGKIWIHCEQNHLVGASSTRCSLYGVRQFQVDDKISFFCADKYRNILSFPNETFFYVERLSK